MNAPAEPLKWTPPPLPSISTDEKKSSISVQPIEDLGLNSDNILAYKSVLLQDVASIKVPICVGYASQLLPELFDMKGLFTASAVGPVNDPKSARSKEKTWAFVGYPDMPPGRAIKGHRPARMLLCINDIDHGSLSADEVQAAVQKFYGEDTTAAIYSTASSRPEDKRWRVVVPLAQAIPTAEWLRLQGGFSEAMAFLKGVEVDHSMDRATQISWGPNVPPDGRDEDGVPLHFEHRFWGQVMFNPAGVLTPTAVTMLEVVDELASAEAQRQQELAVERDRKAAEREAARAEAIANGGEGLSAMERFKLEHTTESLLEKYGYEQNSRKPVEWRSPMQITSEQERIAKGNNTGATSYATKLNDDGSWTSMSESDAKAGIGRRSKGTQHGDAFDLFVFYEHKNDFKAAVAAAGQMYNIKPAAQQPSIDAFTGIPAPANLAPGVLTVEPAPAKPMRYRNQVVSLKDSVNLPMTRWMIKDVLPCTGTCMVYGQTQAGKTFVVIDLVMHLLTKSKTEWFGRRIRNRPTGVFYFAMEDIVGARTRAIAWAKEHGCELPANFQIFDGNDFDLTKTQDAEDIAQVILDAIGEGALFVVDTQIKAAPGADEQSSRDTSIMYKNLQRIAETVKGIAMPVTHAGKDVTLGARGSSAQIAACDMAIVVKNSGDARTWVVDKNKSGPGGGTGHFTIRRCVVGVDADGDDIDAGVLMLRSAPSEDKTPLTPSAKTVLAALEKLIEDSGGAPVDKEAVRKEAYKLFDSDGPKRSQDTLKQNFAAGFKKLTDTNRIFPSGNGYMLGFGTADAPEHMQKLSGRPVEDSS